MIEDFIEWYINSDFIIHEGLRNSIGYLEYEVAWGGLGILAVLFEAIKNLVKSKALEVSNEYLVSVLLLMIAGGLIKPTLDGIAWGTKQIDNVTSLSESDKKVMIQRHLMQKRIELSMEIDTLKKYSDGFSLDLAEKQVQVWTNDMKMASSLMGSASAFPGTGFAGFGLNGFIDTLIGGFRAGLKIYYIAMMNILYLIIPVAYLLSIFKPSHFLKPLGGFLLHGFVLTVINFIEYVIFILFIDKTIDNPDVLSYVFSSSALLYNLLSIFLYIKAMYFARLIIPIPAEDAIGPMVGQAFLATTFLVMQKLGIKSNKVANAVSQSSTGKGGNSDGPLDVTTR